MCPFGECMCNFQPQLFTPCGHCIASHALFSDSIKYTLLRLTPAVFMQHFHRPQPPDTNTNTHNKNGNNIHNKKNYYG